MRFTKAMAVGVEILARTSQTSDPHFPAGLGDCLVSKIISVFMYFIFYPLAIDCVCYQKKSALQNYVLVSQA